MRFGSFEEMLSFYASDEKAVALIHGEKEDTEGITYSELLKLIDDKATELSGKNKTSIGIICSSSVECVVTVFAAVKAKMQVVLIDSGLNASVKKSQIQAADVDMLFSDDKEEEQELSEFLTPGVEKDAERILFFTSGTTSNSKAVVLTEQSLCASAYNGGEKLPLSKDDTLFCILPISHVFGFVCSLLWGLSCGAKVALSRGMRHFMDDFSFFRPTAVSLVPMLLGFFIKNRLFNDELSLILVGAGDCPDSLLDAAKAMGKRVSFGYGLTETSSGVAISVEGNPRAMEICPDDEIMISDEGEILIKAPTCIMQGYYKDKDSTDEALRDGVLYSGDLGFIDMDGKLHITGRKKEMLVLPSGTKIFLPDYEAALAKAIENAELAVILLKNKPVLVIKEIEEKRKEILEKINEEMKKHPRSHQLSQIIFTDNPLPRTATGKIKRWEIQKTEEEKNGKNEQR